MTKKNYQRCYEDALVKWDQLKADGHRSSPAHLGKVAILLPFDHTIKRPADSLNGFLVLKAEALALADRMMETGRSPVLAINATKGDFKSTLTDPSVSDVVVVGNGRLSAVALQKSSTAESYIDWEDVGKFTNHLKTGRFIQRVCGILPRSFNAPLGILAVDDHRNVHAPVGSEIQPTNLEHPDNLLIRPVTTLERMASADIIDHFPMRQLTISQHAHVKLGAIRNLLTQHISNQEV